jgi:hypothetical protein
MEKITLENAVLQGKNLSEQYNDRANDFGYWLDFDVNRKDLDNLSIVIKAHFFESLTKENMHFGTEEQKKQVKELLPKDYRGIPVEIVYCGNHY